MRADEAGRAGQKNAVSGQSRRESIP
jgi:hypothetical protein